MKRIIAASVCALALSALPSVAWGQYAPQYYQPYPTYQAAQTPVYWWWQPPQQQQMPQRMVQPRPAMNVVGPVQQVQASLPQAYVQAQPKAEELPAPKAEAPVAAPVTSVPVDSGCCDPCCAPACCPKGGFMGGASWYFLKPHYDANPAFNAEGTSTGNVDDVIQSEDLEWDYRSAFSVWLAYVSPSGLGGRFRFFSFDQTTDPLTVAYDGNLDIASAPGGEDVVVELDEDGTMTIDSDLNLYYVDLEAIQLFGRGQWSMLVSGGVRIADLSQNYSAITDTNDDSDEEFMTINHGFRGAGPTISVEVRRALANSGLAFYGSARGALLVGESSYSAVEFQLPDLDAADIAGANEWDDTIGVSEFELGLECCKKIGCRCEVFGNVGMVANTWFGAGNASLTELYLDQGGSADSKDSHSNLTLFGVTVGAGVRY